MFGANLRIGFQGRLDVILGADIGNHLLEFFGGGTANSLEIAGVLLLVSGCEQTAGRNGSGNEIEQRQKGDEKKRFRGEHVVGDMRLQRNQLLDKRFWGWTSDFENGRSGKSVVKNRELSQTG